MNHQLTGKCGLYCGACNIYRAERDSAELRRKLAKNAGCSPDQVRCNGCGGLTADCWGNGCKIVQCLAAKGFDFCYECPEFEAGRCGKYEDLYTVYMEAGVDLKKNSGRIKAGQGAQWLRESEELFRCKSCGMPVTVWSVQCHHCGGKNK